MYGVGTRLIASGYVDYVVEEVSQVKSDMVSSSFAMIVLPGP